MSEFTDFALDPLIIQALERLEYKNPTPIQTATIPLILQRRDVIALAKTGSGKTAACAIPICQLVNPERPEIQALIVVPTRELALQYATEAQKIGKDKKVKAFAIYGGEDASMQLSKLKHGVQVLVATPGRLIDFIYNRQIDLTHVETLILDEADEMLSMGFQDDLEFIIQCLNHDHQTLLFSATMPHFIKKIAVSYMKDCVEVMLQGEDANPQSIEHKFVYCRYDQRDQRLAEVIAEAQPTQGIIFCKSRHEVERVCQNLKKRFDGVDFLHAGLGQDIRSIITGKFRNRKVRLLVATDVVARGLDFSGVTHVFIYHLSDDPDVYIHRSGRTGRQGREGTVITLVTDREMHALEKVLSQIKREPIWVGQAPPPRSSGGPGRGRRPPPRHRGRPTTG